MKIIIICVILLCALIPLAILSKKYRNPYKLYMMFGKKGSGKSTLLVRLAIMYAKKGYIVYSNMPIAYDGIRLFNADHIGDYTFPEGSVVFVDEAGTVYDNRQYSKFKESTRDWYKFQRKYKCIVYLFSQTFDIDVKLRNLTDQMYMCTSHANIFSIARRVNRKLIVVEPTGDSEGRITDGYEVQPLIFQLLGIRSIYFTFIPKYAKYFDTRYVEQSKKVPFIHYNEVKIDDESEN